MDLTAQTRQMCQRSHNETLSVAMRVNNPDRSPFAMVELGHIHEVRPREESSFGET